MEILNLFLKFFKIGLFSFGGGYGTISVINTEVVDTGMISQEIFNQMIGVSESTPGPFAVNISTFIGNYLYGFWGSVAATLGVVLPAFLIMILVSTVLRLVIKNKYVAGFLTGTQPFVVGLIISTGLLIILKAIWVNYADFSDAMEISLGAIIIASVVLVVKIGYKKIFKKEVPIIALIALSACMGMLIL